MKAFPSEKKLYWLFRQGDKPIPNEVIEQGMDLRDYFAAKAMQAVIINSDRKSTEISEIENWIGNYAYTVADAMMEARK